MIVFYFPQRVDESFNVAEEEPSQATEEIDPGQFASEGKPTFKTQPDVLHFYIFKYHVFTIMYLLFMYYYIRVGTIVVVLGQRSTYLIPFRNFRVRTTLVDVCIATSLLSFNVYLSYRGIVGLKLPRPTLRIRLCETGCHARHMACTI